ncbi:MAG: hypothetical protein II666_09610 [Butyrivibrio sp.]|nr:hypothetical protein [Butyrivibrio sp.]
MKRKNFKAGKTKKEKKLKTQIKNIRDIPRAEIGDRAYDGLWVLLGFFVFMAFFVVAVVILDDNGQVSVETKVIAVILFVLSVYLMFLKALFRKMRNERVLRMIPSGILYEWPFGITKQHSYSEWADSINAGHYRIGSRGFEFRLGFEKIVFFYNVALLGERKKAEERYNLFVDYLAGADPMIRQKMPKFTKENIDLLDKRCFYQRSRKHQLIVMFFNMLLYLILLSISGGHDAVVTTAILCGLVEIFVFYFLVKGAYYNYKNEMEIREKMSDETGLVRDDGIGNLRPYWGYIYLFLVFAINYAIQCILLWW